MKVMEVMKVMKARA